MENPSRNTHPMMIVAASTLSIASLVAILWILGWIPGIQGNSATPSEPLITAPVALATPAVSERTTPAKTPATKNPLKQTGSIYGTSPAYSNRGAMPVANYPMNDSGVYAENSRQQYPATCRDCATVESIRATKQDGEGTGFGAITGGVVGGLLGNQIGGGRGKTVGAVIGAAGGAYAGHQVEKNVRGTRTFEITVRLDDGTTRIFTETQAPTLQQGDRVRINNGQLARI